MSKMYRVIPSDSEYFEIAQRLVENEEEFNDIKATEPRITMIIVEAEGNEPAFDGLPYRTKINSLKDRVISGKDIIFFIDYKYFARCVENIEKEALVYSCLNSIMLSHKGDDIAVDTDGRPRWKAKPTSMKYEGFAEVAEKYGQYSPEIIKYNELVSYNADVLHGGTTID